MSQQSQNPGHSEPSRKELADAPFTMFDDYAGPQDGTFRVEMDHALVRTAKEGGSKTRDDVQRTEVWKGESALEFRITAPRLVLPVDGLISSKFPAPGASAPFQSILPYVVFSRRSLPWERTLGHVGAEPTKEERTTPWLALVVLTRAELDKATLREAKADALLGDDETHYSPFTDDALKKSYVLSSDEKKLDISLLDLPAGLFRSVCPKGSEISLLAHVREVDLRNKADGRDGRAGRFALLMANRFPGADEHVALVVSLEGWARWLASEEYCKKPMVRLVVLHSWSFFSVAGVGTCAEMAKELGRNVFRFSDEIIDDVGVPEASALLRAGYTPVQHQPDSKDQPPVVAWYRGPLAPVEVADFPEDAQAFPSADTAAVVHPEMGMVDISYAAAWQLGRILALSSSSFSSALQSFSEDVHLARMRLDERNAQVARENAAPKHEPEPAPSLWDEIVHYVEQEAARREGDDSPPLRDDVRIILEWLEAFTLLEPIPLRYLVPSDKLLPSKSIRMFHVDPRWMDAALDGAMSIGEFSLTGGNSRPTNRGAVRRALRYLIGRKRAWKNNEKETKASLGEKAPLSGFLLRSNLIDVAPGVEIEVQQANDKLPLLRLTTIAPGIFLGLCNGRPTKIVIREPREGLRFGVSEKAIVLKETTGAATGEMVDISATLGKEKHAPGVLALDTLAKTLATKLGHEKLTSATFALQMLLAAEDVAIPWHGQSSAQSSSSMRGDR